MNPSFEIVLIALFTSVSCALIGVFLVLRKMALISDAISHSILPGIVLGFMFTHDLNHPLLILFASLSGLLTVVVVEWVQKSGWVKKDTAIGLVFPGMFSIGVLLIAQNANDVHLDIDAVLLGELAFAPFQRMELFGTDVGAKGLWYGVGLATIVSVLLLLFYKELKITTFDSALANALGFSPWLLHYGLMGMTSVVSVVAFDVVGAILVVALIIAPAASAYLLTHKLNKLIPLAVCFGMLATILGYMLAKAFDLAISGSICVVLGFIFLMTFLFAPKRGLIATLTRRNRQQKEVALITFLLHLNNHKNEQKEREVVHLGEHINWGRLKAKSVLVLAKKNNFIVVEHGVANLTKKGEAFTDLALNYILANKKEGIEEAKEHFFLFRA